MWIARFCIASSTVESTLFLRHIMPGQTYVMTTLTVPLGSWLRFTVQGDCPQNEVDDDDDEIAYFTVRWKTRELVLSTAPKTWGNTDKDSKNRKQSH